MSLPSAAEPNTSQLTQQDEKWYASDEGKEQLDCILSWQSERGDWPQLEVDAKPFAGDRDEIQGTFKDQATTDPLRKLARAFQLTGRQEYKQAFEKGLDLILECQHESGGWPECGTPNKKESRPIAFVDNSMVSVMELLRDLSSRDQFAFLDSDRRKRAAQALANGVECIRKCQIVSDGVASIWCGTYHAQSLEPVKQSKSAALLRTAESSRILVFLMSIEEPSLEVIEVVQSGIRWLDENMIEGFRYRQGAKKPALTKDPSATHLWSKLYQIGTSKPAFIESNDSLKFDVNKLSKKQRKDVAWYGVAGKVAIEAYESWPNF